MKGNSSVQRPPLKLDGAPPISPDQGLLSRDYGVAEELFHVSSASVIMVGAALVSSIHMRKAQAGEVQQQISWPRASSLSASAGSMAPCNAAGVQPLDTVIGNPAPPAHSNHPRTKMPDTPALKSLRFPTATSSLFLKGRVSPAGRSHAADILEIGGPCFQALMLELQPTALACSRELLGTQGVIGEGFRQPGNHYGSPGSGRKGSPREA